MTLLLVCLLAFRTRFFVSAGGSRLTKKPALRKAADPLELQCNILPNAIVSDCLYWIYFSNPRTSASRKSRLSAVT